MTRVATPSGTRSVTGSVLENARWLSVAGVVVGLLNYAYSLGMTHLLPAHDFGVFAAGQGIVLAAGTVAGSCGAWILAEALNRSTSELERWRAVRFSLRVNIGAGVLAGSIAGLVASRVASGPVVLVLALGSFMVFPAATAYGYWQGVGSLRTLAGSRIGETLVKCLAGILLVGFGAGAAGASAGVLAGSVAIAAVGGLVVLRRVKPVAGSVVVATLWASALGVTAVQGALALFSALDQVLVAVVVSDPAAAAPYQTATIVARVPLFLAAAVGTAIYATIVAGEPGTSEIVRDAVRAHLAAALPFALVLATVPGPIVTLLLPSGYDRTVSLLPYAATGGVLLSVLVLVATVLQARGRTVSTAGALGAGTGLQVIALFTGHTVGGVTGLAVGAVAGTACTVVLLLVIAPPDLRRAFRPSARLSLVCSLLLAVLVLTRAWSTAWLTVAVVAGAGTGMSYLFGRSTRGLTVRRALHRHGRRAGQVPGARRSR